MRPSQCLHGQNEYIWHRLSETFSFDIPLRSFWPYAPDSPPHHVPKPPLSLGASTPIRSSDRRKLITSLSLQYPSIPPDTLKLLVPDGIRSGNVRTSGEIDGVIYSDPSNGNSLWVAMTIVPPSGGRKDGERRFWPTLYTVAAHLAMNPAPERPILPLLPIHQPPPTQWLTGGAPLFVPAVKFLSQPHLLPALTTSSSASSTSTTAPSNHPTPFVLFVTPLPSSSQSSSNDQYQILGIGQFTSSHTAFSAHLDAWIHSKEVIEKGTHSLGDADVGRLCDTLEMAGDTLWNMGTRQSLPTISYSKPEFPMRPPPGGLPRSSPAASLTEPQIPMEGLNITSDASSTSTPDSQNVIPLTTSEIDHLLTLSLLQSLPLIPPSSLPMQSSTLYSAHILPNRPASIPRAQREEVVIGKSGWKKVGKWMKVLGDGRGGQGLLRVKEAKDGSHMILGINQSHDLIQTHKQHRTIAQELAREAKQNSENGSGVTNGSGHAGEAVSSTVESGGGQTKGKGKALQVEEFWRPSNVGVTFWESVGFEKNAYLTHQQILDALNQYILDKKLPNMKDRASINVDEPLGWACGLLSKKNKLFDVREVASMTVRKDRVLEGLKSEMSAAVRIGGEGGTIKKGTLDPIRIATKSRGGKNVTLVFNMETFGIDPNDLAEELKRVCAGSAAVDPLTGAPPAANKKEVMIQGSQVKSVTEVLMVRGVPRKWIKEDAGVKGK